MSCSELQRPIRTQVIAWHPLFFVYMFSFHSFTLVVFVSSNHLAQHARARHPTTFPTGLFPKTFRRGTSQCCVVVADLKSILAPKSEPSSSSSSSSSSEAAAAPEALQDSPGTGTKRKRPAEPPEAPLSLASLPSTQPLPPLPSPPHSSSLQLIVDSPPTQFIAPSSSSSSSLTDSQELGVDASPPPMSDSDSTAQVTSVEEIAAMANAAAIRYQTYLLQLYSYAYSIFPRPSPIHSDLSNSSAPDASPGSGGDGDSCPSSSPSPPP